MQRQGQRRLDRALRQPFEHPHIAHRREHQVLVGDIAFGSQQRDRVHDIVQIMGRLAHAHEHDLLDGAQGARQHHLSDDFATADLAQQAVAARHAELAADGAPHLA